MTTVALVDDHRLFRQGLRSLLSLQKDMQVVAEASNAREAYEAVERTAPEVVVLDVLLPGVTGIEVARELLRKNPQQRLLALSMVHDEPYVAQALDAGMLGYAVKEQSMDDVVEAIRSVAQRRQYLAPGISRSVFDDVRSQPRRTEVASLATLTAREREVFDLTVGGMASADVAKHLHISRRTVETHRARILHKLHARSATDLVRMAARWGVLPLS